MEFRTQFKIEALKSKISYRDKIVSIGSCFSENIGKKLSYFGWKVQNNSFGTIFHPLAIAQILKQAIENDTHIRICKKDEQFCAFETHSKISAETTVKLEENFALALSKFASNLADCNWLIVTFGTAWGYFLDDTIVANCHKQPQSMFEKKLSEIDAMKIVWMDLIRVLKQKNPKIKLIFTVSPVRHTKDGMVENQRSKARLIELVHQLNENYFPAYEIMMDDLRDYRFYEKDMLHPSETAIDYIFEQFAASAIDEKSRVLFPQIDKLRKAENHRVLNNTNESNPFTIAQAEKRNNFLKQHPTIVWGQ